MCGIAGICNVSALKSRVSIRKMVDHLFHRGPDSQRVWESSDEIVVMGHTRLSITDLAVEANQPMVYEIGGEQISLVFNGEIYNHVQLRSALERSGSIFETNHSDTETILRGYLHWGIELLLEKLSGMFTFAIFDQRVQKVFLARDEFGVKPLYYCKTTEGLAFASEIGAIFKSSLVTPEFDELGLQAQLAFRALPAPFTLFKSVKKLGPGSYAVYELASNDFVVRKYWNPLALDRVIMSTGEAIEELAYLLESSCDLQSLSDVSQGIFLSGGLDSNFVLKEMSQKGRLQASYTASFPTHVEFDEADQVRKYSAISDLNHTFVPIDATSYFDDFASVCEILDEPIAAPVCVPVWNLCQAAANDGVKVMMAGEGADELFIGYQSWLKVRDLQRAINAVDCGISRNVTSKMASVLRQFRVGSREAEFLDRAAKGQPLFWGGAMDFTEGQRKLLLGVADDDLFERFIEPFWIEYRQYRDKTDITGWMSYLDLNFRLPELMLPRLDMMSMAESIESRVPFLDKRVAELIFKISPAHHNGHSRVGKELFRSVIKKKYPSFDAFQGKRGFRAPVDQWKNESAVIDELASFKKFTRDTGVFSENGVDQILSNRPGRLFLPLLGFQRWYEKFF